MNKNIVCIGAGYIGGPTMAVIAKMNPDRKIIVVDINEKRIAAWNSADYQLPIYEPGLVEVVKEVRGKNLFFSTDIKKAVQDCDIIFVGVNTPTKMFGRGAGRASDLQYWEMTARNIKKWAAHDKIIVEKSTLPVRTAAAMNAILNSDANSNFVNVRGSDTFYGVGIYGVLWRLAGRLGCGALSVVAKILLRNFRNAKGVYGIIKA